MIFYSIYDELSKKIVSTKLTNYRFTIEDYPQNKVIPLYTKMKGPVFYAKESSLGDYDKINYNTIDDLFYMGDSGEVESKYYESKVVYHLNDNLILEFELRVTSKGYKNISELDDYVTKTNISFTPSDMYNPKDNIILFEFDDFLNLGEVVKYVSSKMLLLKKYNYKVSDIEYGKDKDGFWWDIEYSIEKYNK